MSVSDNDGVNSDLELAWQYTVTTPILAKDAIQALLIMWGAMADAEAFRHHPAASIRSWILERTREIVRNYPASMNTIDTEFMDRESGILFGSPHRVEKPYIFVTQTIDDVVPVYE